MRNGLNDLNDYLFEQIERINDDELHGEELDEQIRKAKAVNDVAMTIVRNAAVMVQGIKVASEYGLDAKDMPVMITAGRGNP